MKEPSPDAVKETREWVFVAVCGAALWIINGIWLAIDSRPPVWDMALHQAYALNYVPGFSALNAARAWQLSGNYPPLVHLFIAATFWLLHPNPGIAALANLPATFLLMWSVFELGRYFASSSAAKWACVLLLLTPYVTWMSRETILDYWLSAWVALAWLVLLRTQGFESRSASRLFGVVCGLGLLTKWLFAGFVAAPFVLTAVRYRVWTNRSRWIRLLEATAIAAILAGTWYVPNLPGLVRYFSENARIGALEGEPPVFSFQSAIYYLRLLEGYQLYALLFVILVGGIVHVLRRHAFKDFHFWLIGVAGGWVVLTLLRTKDPRFSMPLVGPILIVPGAWLASWDRLRFRRLVQGALLAVLCLQAYATNFGIRWLPAQVVLWPGYQGSLRWDWQLFSQHYFGILGPPRREDWKQDEILTRLAQEARARGSGMSLAFVPDLPRFNTSNFFLAAKERKMSIRFGLIRSSAAGLAEFGDFDFVVVTEREQGMPWTTYSAPVLTQFVMNDGGTFKRVGDFPLPNGDVAHLCFIDRRAVIGK